MRDFDGLKRQLRKLFPEVGLTWGYTGNIWRPGDFSDLRYSYFTRVPTPTRSGGKFRFPAYGVSHEQLDHLWEVVSDGKLERWLREEVMPHAHNAWRVFEVRGAGVEVIAWPWLVARGASYGAFGGGHIAFCVQHITLEDLRREFPQFTWDIDHLETHQDAE